MILNQKGLSENNILIINSEDDNISNLNTRLFIRKPRDMNESIEDFLSLVENWFAKVSESMKEVYDEEPARLLTKKEYRAAVISAITLLEVHLKSKIDISNHSYPNKFGQSIYTLAFRSEIIDENQFSLIKKWTYTRNQLVHSTANVNGNEARSIVTGVNKIIRSLKSN